MSNSLSLVKKSALLILAVMLVALAGLIPVVIQLDASSFDETATNGSVAFAADSSGGTMLNGYGLQVGNNQFDTRADNSEGYKTGSGSFSNARDIYVQSSTSYEYASAALTLTNGTAIIKLPLYNPDTEGNQSLAELYGGVYYAIKDTNTVVTATLGGSLTNQDAASNTTVNITLLCYFGASGGSSVSTTTSMVLGAGESDATLSGIKLENINRSSICNGAYFQITFQSTGAFSLASPTMEIAVDSGDNISIGEQVVYEITGKNRQSVGPMTSGNETMVYYIKSGDTIILRAKAYQGSSTSLYHFPDYYQGIYDTLGSAGLYWNVYTYSKDNPTVKDTNTTYVSKVNRSSYYSEDGEWYEVEYIVQEGVGNVSAIYFEPMIYTKRNGSGKTAISKTPVKFNVDDSAPDAPVIATDSAFGAAIESGTWYTGSSSNSPKLTFSEVTHTVLANEYVYAFVVPSTVITISGINDYDFTPGLSDTENAITYETGKTAVRQEVISYATNGTITTKSCNFEKSGQWGLVLFRVDAAGNVSDPKYYNDYNYNPIYIDGTKYQVGTNFLLGSATITNYSTLGTIYVITGEGTHDSEGNLIPSTDYLSGTYKKSNMRATVARLQWVTIRIAMTELQYSNYQMVSYTNKGTINGSDVEFVAPTERGRPYYFDLPSFQVTDDFVTNDQAGIVDCVFRARVKLEVIGSASDGTTKYETYTGSSISIADSVEVHTNDNASTLIQNIKVDVNYFKIYELIVYPDDSGIGGTIAFDGQNFVFDEGNLIALDQELDLGSKTYTTFARTKNADKEGKTNYTVKCYCANEPRLDEDGYSKGFVDAGSYYYTACVNQDEVRYYGQTAGILVINKASPNVTDISANVLTYGVVDNDGKKGLELLEFESLSENGTRLLYSSADNRYIFGKTYYDSYYGVLGMYTITTPTTADAVYYYPDVTDAMKITVVFTPITIDKGAVVNGYTIDDSFIADNYNIMQRYYTMLGDGSFELKEGGLHAGNYDTQTLVLTIKVTHALVESEDITLNCETKVEYDGNQKNITLVTKPADLPYVVYYKLKDEPDSAFTTTCPFNAGEYVVKYYIDSSSCNYYSEAQEINFTIEKRELNLELTSYTNIISKPYVYEGYAPFTQRVDVSYGYFTRPALEASYMVGEQKNIINVIYTISYMMIEDYAGVAVASPSMSSPIEEDALDSASVDAGLYLVKLQVNNTNNMGAITCLVKIAPASTSGSDNLVISYPALNSTYSAYTLQQNTLMTIGTDSTIGNIEYGQRIADKEESLIALTEATIAQYRFRGETSRQNISGRFYLEKEFSIMTRYGLEFTTVNSKGEYILPVLYEEDLTGTLNNIGAYEIYLYWQAGEYDEATGDFIPNNNYTIESIKQTFYVVRATPDFENVTLSTLIYGQTLDQATFVGIPEVSGGMNIGGQNYTGDKDDIAAIFGTKYVGQYVLAGYQDGQLAYVLGYELSSSTVFQRGTYDVDCVFTPIGEFAKSYCKIRSIKIKITISAKPATITFDLDENNLVSHPFGASYADPVVVTNPENISVRFEFFTVDDEPLTLSSTTPVGEYKVRAVIDDDNYEGEVNSPFYVVKSGLYLSIAPTNAPQTYGVTLGEISLSAGRCYSLANIAVDGTFAFVNATEVPEVGTAYYLVRFTPNDATAYDSYQVFEYQYALTVSKAEVVIEYSNLVHTYDGLGKIPTISSKDPNGNDLEVQITYTNWVPTESTPIPELAGEYKLNLEVNTNHYYKSVNVTMIINKAYANIDSTPQYAKYTGAAKAYVPVFDVDALTYKLSYINYYGTSVATPIDVGEYTVTVEIEHTNYQGTFNVKFYIEPYSYTVNDLQQTYNPFGNQGVTATFLPEEVNYSVLYRSVSSTGAFTEAVPTEAGTYDVIIRINQYGYTADKNTMIVGESEEPIRLQIDPATAIISAPAFYRVYTARPHLDLVCDVTPSVSTSYKYRVAGSSEEYSSTQPILSGSYEVLVEISDKNYVGSAETTLYIDKATPIVGTLPAITSTNSFNSAMDLVTFSASGSVIFSATGEYITSKGHWEIDEDPDAFELLPVGTHNIHIMFVPDDTDNFYPAKYYDSASTEEVTMDIIISKRDLGAYIGFNDAQRIQNYKAKQLYVDAFLTDKSVLVEGYTDPTIVVTYNGQQIRPTSVGTYVLGAYILDDNYTGNATESTLTIYRADLSISLPTLGDVGVGQKLSTSTITGGYAYIQQDEGEISATVDGDFSFTYPDTVFTRANYQRVWLTFTPTDVYNHNVHNFQMEIKVIGEDVVITGVKASGITFGQPLSDSIITYESTSVPGTFSWQNPDMILTTGELGTYVFTPDEHDIYNIVVDTVEVEVAQATMWLDMNSFDAKLYVTSETSYEDITYTMNLYHDDHRGDENWLISGVAITLTSTNRPVTKVEDPNENVTIRISHRDYKPLEAKITVRTYYELKESNFQVHSPSKIYDGEPVTIEDLNAKVVSTDYEIKPTDFTMTIRKDGVLVSEMVDAGEYDVTLTIKTKEVVDGTTVYRDIAYDGSYSFKYNINKLDISDAIDVPTANLTKTYGDYATTLGATFGDYAVLAKEVIYSYYSLDMSAEYGVVGPQSAGSYKVKVSISSDNKWYTGSKVFDYEITKREATIRLDSQYVATYGQSFSIVPDISNNITSQNYIVTYNNSTTIPENIGEYVVKFVINHPNFYGEASTHLSIRQVVPELDEKPNLSAITYGQELYNSIISGGRVVYGSAATEVPGTFEFKNPDDASLPAGTNQVIMIFKPTNTNFSSLQLEVDIVVNKGVASIELVKPTAVYDGTVKAPQFVTQPLAGLATKVVYRQDLQRTQAIDAGEYEVTITIEDPNYTGSNVFTFTILKATPVAVVEPVASDLSYGQSLEFSSLVGGSVTYVQDANPVAGTFKYTNNGMQLGDVGTYHNVEYTFTPADTKNYEIHTGYVTVIVNKAIAKITVSDVSFTYGDRITNPTFTTEPANLAVENSEFVAAGLLGEVPHVNTFEFDAKIEDDNYEGSVTYIITVAKKKLSVKFVNENNVKVDRYTTTYNKVIYAKIAIDESSLASQDIPYKSDITTYITYSYSTGSRITPYTHVPPTSVGEYEVYCDMNHTDYYIDASSTTIPYIINRAKVERLEFETSSLSDQIYGSVSIPTVTTTPANINYTISFPGYAYMPTDAGTYSVKVLVVDDNFEPAEKSSMFRISPKDITIESITCENRVVDGTANITVNGELKGVLVGDEVTLSMKAKTENGETTAGTYKVKITEYTLSGLHAGNYNVLEPIYSLDVKLKSKEVVDSVSGSYITSSNGLSENITVTFSAVEDTQNKSNLFSSILGQDAVVQTFEIKENGVRTTLASKIKVYVKIPDKYLGSSNIVVEGMGDLSTETITFSREGDYITFYTDRSGEVIIYTEDFPYWVIIVIAIVIMIVIGVVCIFVFSPIKRRVRVPAYARREFAKEQAAKAEYRRTHPKNNMGFPGMKF